MHQHVTGPGTLRDEAIPPEYFLDFRSPYRAPDPQPLHSYNYQFANGFFPPRRGCEFIHPGYYTSPYQQGYPCEGFYCPASQDSCMFPGGQAAYPPHLVHVSPQPPYSQYFHEPPPKLRYLSASPVEYCATRTVEHPKYRKSISTVAQCEIIGEPGRFQCGTDKPQAPYSDVVLVNNKSGDTSTTSSFFRMPLMFRAGAKGVASPSAIAHINENEVAESKNKGDNLGLGCQIKSIVSPTPIAAGDVMEMIKSANSDQAALEMLRQANETNLKIIHDAKFGAANAANTALNPSGDFKLANVEDAIKVMKKLNPMMQDDTKLMEILQAYIIGKPLDLEMIRKSMESSYKDNVLSSAEAAVKTMLIPMNAADFGGSPKGTRPENIGFEATHQFSMKLANNERIDYTAVKIIESPLVQAVANLLDPQECVDLIGLCSDQFSPCKTVPMTLKIGDTCQTYYVPNEDLCMNDGGNEDKSSLSDYSKYRNCLTTYKKFSDFEGHEYYPFLKSLQMRAAAVCKCDVSQIEGVCIEQFNPGCMGSFIHFSNRREGAVIVALSNGCSNAGGSIFFPLAGLELIARAGLALHIPSIYPGTGENPQIQPDAAAASPKSPIKYPDPRSEISVSKVEDESDPIFYAVFYVHMRSS